MSDHRSQDNLARILSAADDQMDETEPAVPLAGPEDVSPLMGLFSESDLKLLEALPQAQVLEILGRVLRGEDFREALKKTAPEVVDRYEAVVDSQYRDSGPDAGDLEAQEALHDESTGLIFINKDLAKIAEFTPLRLSHAEREYLRLAEGALKVSEYTDRVDILSGGRSRASRMAREIKQICKVLTGLIVAHDHAAGKKLIQSNDFEIHADVFQTIFEIVRRYKILNPECLRDAYGKCIYLLMDSRKAEIQELLEFDLVRPITTVADICRQHGITGLLEDDRLRYATMEIVHQGRPRRDVDHDIQLKQQAVRDLSKEYANYNPPSKRTGLGALGLRTARFFFGRDESSDVDDPNDLSKEGRISSESIEQVIYSLCDHHSHIRACVYPLDDLIGLLQRYFDPNKPTNDANHLEIYAGHGGARLSHPHKRQYQYVEQTLRFWKAMLEHFFQLWTFAERDLLSENKGYMLRDTGQGLNRVQQASSVGSAVNKILSSVKSQMGYWIGSDAVHLGDHNVPNALMFIDKYTQIPRIIGPLMTSIQRLPDVYRGPMGESVENTFGRLDDVITVILRDFFRHGFDGSGADNFFDAGSCIDGRLTSVWNWCSRIHKKEYYPLFQLTGFTGFDGDFH